MCKVAINQKNPDQTIWIHRFDGLETLFLSLIYEKSRSRFMLELSQLTVIFMSILILRLVVQLIRWFNGGSDNTALLPLLLWRSGLLDLIWILDTFGAIGLAVLSGLGCRYTHPGCWIHLPFRGHWPNRLRSNNGSCSRTKDWQLSTYPRRRIPAFISHGIKAGLCVVLVVVFVDTTVTYFKASKSLERWFQHCSMICVPHSNDDFYNI